MGKRGPIRIPTDDEIFEREPVDDTDPPEVVLPSTTVIDAGLKRFRELAALHWPQKGGTSVSFNVSNAMQMRMVLGLVYMAMRTVDDDRTKYTGL